MTDDSDESPDDVAGMYEDPSGDFPEELSSGGSTSSDEDSVEGGETPESGALDEEGDNQSDEQLSPRFDAPLMDEGGGPESAAGTFYVKYANETAVTLHDINSSQIFTLIENPGLEPRDIVEATLVAQPPMEVSYLIDELEAHYTIPVEVSEEPPTEHVREIALQLDAMEAVAVEREGEGEIHVLRVEPEDVEQTAEELPEDEMTYKNAARYGVDRVEIRTDEDDGFVSIRYLP